MKRCELFIKDKSFKDRVNVTLKINDIKFVEINNLRYEIFVDEDKIKYLNGFEYMACIRCE